MGVENTWVILGTYKQQCLQAYSAYRRLVLFSRVNQTLLWRESNLCPCKWKTVPPLSQQFRFASKIGKIHGIILADKVAQCLQAQIEALNINCGTLGTYDLECLHTFFFNPARQRAQVTCDTQPSTSKKTPWQTTSRQRAKTKHGKVAECDQKMRHHHGGHARGETFSLCCIRK